MERSSSESDLLSENNELKSNANNSKSQKVRNLVAFWMLGLCNNYGYVIMLSAAFDILHSKTAENKNTEAANATNAPNITNSSLPVLCNPTSTGAILLADILPALFIKFVAPFFFRATHFRMALAILLSLSSFLLTSLSLTSWMSFLGVVCASLSSGLGEVTILSYSSFFDKNVVSTWSSGTGAAGVLGAVSYASLAKWLGPRTSLQIMLIIPITMAIIFWLLLVHPQRDSQRCFFKNKEYSNVQPYDMPTVTENDDFILPPERIRSFTLKEKLSIVRSLLKYMIPLGFVYFAEYFINQGLLELIYFENIWLDHAEQYRWYQVVYQVGVLVSRSSVNVIRIKKLWLLPILQMMNAVFMFFVVYYVFLPSIWIVLAVILYEGLLGGAAYVNTFYTITVKQAEPAEREFSLGITSLSDSMGIAFAGAIALPVHNALCRVL